MKYILCVCMRATYEVGRRYSILYLHMQKVHNIVHKSNSQTSHFEVNFFQTLHNFYINMFKHHSSTKTVLFIHFILFFSIETLKRRWQCSTDSTQTPRSPVRKRQPKGLAMRTSTWTADLPGGSRRSQESGPCLMNLTLLMLPR